MISSFKALADAALEVKQCCQAVHELHKEIIATTLTMLAAKQGAQAKELADAVPVNKQRRHKANEFWQVEATKATMFKAEQRKLKEAVHGKALADATLADMQHCHKAIKCATLLADVVFTNKKQLYKGADQ